MEMKARKYEALKRGDYSGMTEKERMESVIDVCPSFVLKGGYVLLMFAREALMIV